MFILLIVHTQNTQVTMLGPINRTVSGYNPSMTQAVHIVQDCLNGILDHTSRQPHTSEWPEIVEEGNTFVWEEKSSGIKRWDDLLDWTSSTQIGDFFIETMPVATSKWPSNKVVPEGLMKMTYTLSRGGIDHNLVSYQARDITIPFQQARL